MLGRPFLSSCVTPTSLFPKQLSTMVHEIRRSLHVGIIGAGRIGMVHAQSAIRAGAKPIMIADVNSDAAMQAAQKFGIPQWVTSANELCENPQIDAVIICSPTPLHAEHIQLAAKNKKHIFCEKPIHLDLNVIRQLIPVVEASGVKMMMGYNRRFDANFKRIKSAITSGEIGDLQYLRITSRDPSPPSPDYIKNSGGLFYDMMIHDFDMARFLTGREVEEVYAVGSCLIDPEIGKAGDIDSAVCLLKFQKSENNINETITVTIENSRQAVYGYDQRIEAFGSQGIAQANNNYPNNVVIGNAHTMKRDLPLNFFLERYMDSYIEEIGTFIEAIRKDQPIDVGLQDGLKSILLAKAALQSLRENRPVKLKDIQ